jgi:hypothetical protein
LNHRDAAIDAVINYTLTRSATLDVGKRNRFAYFSPAEREVIAEFVAYRQSLER